MPQFDEAGKQDYAAVTLVLQMVVAPQTHINPSQTHGHVHPFIPTHTHMHSHACRLSQSWLLRHSMHTQRHARISRVLTPWQKRHQKKLKYHKKLEGLL